MWAGYIIWNIIALISGLDNVLKTVETLKKKFYYSFLFIYFLFCLSFFFVFVIFLQNLLDYAV